MVRDFASGLFALFDSMGGQDCGFESLGERCYVSGLAEPAGTGKVQDAWDVAYGGGDDGDPGGDGFEQGQGHGLALRRQDEDVDGAEKCRRIVAEAAEFD